MNFEGTVRIVEKDDATYSVSLSAKGREKNGRGMAEAAIDAHLETISPSETRVVVDTDLKIMGKIAQFGRGIIRDVSKQLIDQFSSNLDQLMSSSQDHGAPVALPSNGENALELGSVLSGVLAKWLVPLAVVALIVVLVLVF